MPVLTVLYNHTRLEIQVDAGSTVLEGLRLSGLSHHADAPCGGNGLCGKCLVTVSGAVAAPDAREQALLAGKSERRLACLARIEGACTVSLAEDDGLTVVENSVFRFEADGKRRGLGAAVDIGTTTVALYLYDLRTGVRLATASGANGQRSYGADVISRIQYAMEHVDGLSVQTAAIRAQLRQLLREACEKARRTPEEVTAVAVAGNTVMEHLLTGLDPSGIAAAPFTPRSLFGESVSAEEYDLGTAPGTALYIAPCVSGYVGGDITAGLMAVKALEKEQPILFVDVGTNGEMAVGDHRGLTCCATAAGPAFEGGSISCGMAASPGAIDRVWVEDGALRVSVLGGGEAIGVCGSGLVDTLAALLELEIVDETGRLQPADEAPGAYADRLEGEGGNVRFRLSGDVWITAEDIRKLQLAKAAVAAGIETLLEHQKILPEQLGAFYLAGGFGSYLRPESAVRIGLFPAALLDRLQVVGNSAGAGASMLLLSDKAGEDLRRTKEQCTYLELSGMAQFNNAYMMCMMFE
ncbi:ASKHA domain-containing protein [Oscillibacter sp.]|uniref:ASKHA domain-containing protein n=1 Tax=Oscillibacter sp. TaxID=1945593 RepID=UPI002603F830|nr:ASKHA domain-containing protein [Oscillibacter sp.]MDD3347210.1 ASKHA domain-containing protein [Oscillibacter sp.]